MIRRKTYRSMDLRLSLITAPLEKGKEKKQCVPRAYLEVSFLVHEANSQVFPLFCASLLPFI